MKTGDKNKNKNVAGYIEQRIKLMGGDINFENLGEHA